ncbi:MAG: protein kinase [Pyrinomonadaceae bacterium]|nr:protein kinase [Pyrinomonadaceae bacterium]
MFGSVGLFLMTPERWREIEDVFHSCLEQDPAERKVTLDEITTRDPELAKEVDKLLHQFELAESFIEEPITPSAKGEVFAALFDDSDLDPLIGKTLGAYRIEREIGRGGMGAVYEATRSDGEFRRKAAIKVVKRGVDTDFVLRRFRNERQILAALDHPYITRLIDGGTTDDGRPYFVMDLIDGEPLYAFADGNRLSLNDRLLLFGRICQAVEYAHERRIIHRDLKPGNIFVASDGSPRLLDFGIAKLLDAELAIDTLQPTATAIRMMTVDYASPEQVRGETVTYASDVYSLGVILYELLSGRRPYRIESRNSLEAAKAVCDQEPLPPSQALDDQSLPTPTARNGSGKSGQELAGARNGSPTDIENLLAGDLDNIVMRALRKDPAERYPSVAELRKDLERYLGGENIDITPFVSHPKEDARDGSKVLAVLPLSFLASGLDAEQDEDSAYLTIGIADAIISKLAGISGLTVRPTSSIARFNGKTLNPLRVGRELDTDFVLDGRIRRFGGRIRVSFQLLEVGKGAAVWAGHFDESSKDILELEDAVSENVVKVLTPQLTGAEKRRVARRGTNDARAHDAYLRGRFYWNHFTGSSIGMALEGFKEAVEIDPNYALAHVGIADYHMWSAIYGLTPSAVSLDRCEEAARKAIAIDDRLGEAYATLGLVLSSRFDYEESEECFKRALALNPGYSLSHEWYAALLISTGRKDEGRKEIEVAIQLDPLSVRTQVLFTWYLYQLRDFDRALERAREIVRPDPNFAQGQTQLAYIASQAGHCEEALAAGEIAGQLAPGLSLATFERACVFASCGQPERAAELRDELVERAKHEDVKPLFLGYASLAADDKAAAVEYFKEAIAEYDPWLVWFPTEPRLDPVRDDPEFAPVFAALRERQAAQRRRSGTSAVHDRNTADAFHQAETQIHESRHRFGRKLKAAGLFAALLIIGFTVLHFSGIFPFQRLFGSGQPIVHAGKTVAVLPFRNETGDPANDYLVSGMADSIAGTLGLFDDLRVISQTTINKIGPETPPMDAGKRIGADTVVVGIVTRENNELKVDTKVLDVATGGTVTEFSLAESADGMAELQAGLQTRLLKTFGIAGQTDAVKRSFTESGRAFDLYLKGEFDRHRSTPRGISESIENYKKAIENDPNYALAFQGLALSYRSAPAFGVLPPEEAYPKARDAALTALRLDPTLSTPYVTLASIQATYDWDFKGAEQQYLEAIRRAPNSAEAHYSYGNFLVAMERTDEAMSEYRTAQQADPLNLNVATNISWALYVAGRYDEATGQITQVIERDPTFARAYLNLGEIQQQQGKFAQAVESVKKAFELSKDPLTEMALGHVYATAGRKKEALGIALSLEDRVRKGEVSAFLPAVIYAGLDDKDKAFYWLERAFQQRSNWLTLLKAGHRLKNLHGDPRFDDLLNRVGFPANK